MKTTGRLGEAARRLRCGDHTRILFRTKIAGKNRTIPRAGMSKKLRADAFVDQSERATRPRRPALRGWAERL